MASNNQTRTLQASTAKTSSFNTAGLPIQNSTQLAVYVIVTATSGTTPTLDIKVQGSPDDVNYADIGSAFPQITGNGVYRLFVTNAVDNIIRLVNTIGGTTPSFTYSIVVTDTQS